MRNLAGGIALVVLCFFMGCWAYAFFSQFSAVMIEQPAIDITDPVLYPEEEVNEN